MTRRKISKRKKKKKQNSHRKKETKRGTVVTAYTIRSTVSCFSVTRSCVMPVVSTPFIFSCFNVIDAEAHGNGIVNQDNHCVFGLSPNTTRNLSGEKTTTETEVSRGSKSHAGARIPCRNFPAGKIRFSCQSLCSVTLLTNTRGHNMKCCMNELFTPIFKEKR